MRNVVQFKDKNDELYAVKDIVARGVKANAVNLFNYKNASGEVVSVDDAADESLLKLKVKINPVQDLHGYDNPWPGGRGKNLNEFTGERTNTSKNVEFSASVGSHFTASGTANGTNATIDYTTIHPFTFIAGTKYIFSFTGTGVNLISYVFLYDDNKAGTGSIQITNGVGEFVPEANASASYIRIRLNTSDGTAVSVDCNWQVEIGNSATAWSPYENICPITGSEKCRIVRIGEDLIDPSQNTYNKYIDTGGAVKTSNSGLYYTGLIPVVPGKSYVFNIIDTYEYTAYVTRSISGYKADGTFVRRILSETIPENTPSFNTAYIITIPEDVAAVRLNAQVNDGSTQFFEGASTKNVFDIPFPTPPGTVFDGELTINQDGTGTLTVNSVRDTVSDLATYTSFTKGTYTCVKRFTLSQATNKCALNETHGAIASFGVEFSAYWGTVRANEQESKLVQFAIGANGTIFTIYDSDLSLDDTAFMQKYGDQQVCYPLDTPITYELSNKQVIQLLEGHNTLWADTGSIEIDYPVEKLISKKEADESYSGMVYIETESDSILDIEDGADAVPAKELIVNISHVQDLHGYDNPWPGGGGKNKLDNDAFKTFANWNAGLVSVGTYSTSVTFKGYDITSLLTVGTQYTISFAFPSTGLPVYCSLCSSDGTTSSRLKAFTDGTQSVINTSHTFTPEAGLTYYIRSGTCTTESDFNNTVKNIVSVQLEVGSTATDFVPYENICPIDGWDSTDVARTGKNLLQIKASDVKSWNASTGSWSGNVYTRNGITHELVTDGNDNVVAIKSNGTATGNSSITILVANYHQYLDLIKNKASILNGCPSGGSSSTYNISVYGNKNGERSSVRDLGNGIALNPDTFDASNSDQELTIRPTVQQGTAVSNLMFYPMIRFATTIDASYEPFGNTYVYPFPETIYDGNLVIHQDGTGTLVQTRTVHIYDGTENILLNSTAGKFKMVNSFGWMRDADGGQGISNMLKRDNSGDYTFALSNNIYFGWAECADAAAMKAKLAELYNAGTPLIMSYKLSEPISYTLTNQQVVELLRGENHIWANCGNVKVTYPADTEIYIQKKVDSIDLDSKADKANPVFTGSISMGRNPAKETGQSSVATGMSAAATATGSHAEGYFTEATGEYSHAEGYETKAYGQDAHAEGRGTLARAEGAHAEGYKTEASGLRSHAEGYFAKATGDYSHAEGDSNKAIGKGSHAEGYFSEASGEYTHVEGNYNRANGSYSHVFGKFASGDSFAKWAPHFMPDTEYAVGDKVWSEIIIMGEESVEIVYEGYVCNTAHTSGSAIDEAYWTRRNGLMKYAEIVGNGTGLSDALRSNARALDWDGNEYLNGDLYVKCNPDSTGGVKAATMNDIADLTKVTAPIINVEDDTPEATKTIHDGAEGMPVKQLTVNIEPVQDLHGYDNPWPAGGGANILPMPIVSGSYANQTTVVVNDDLSFYITKANGTNWTGFDLAQGMMLEAGDYVLIESDDGSQNATIGITKASDSSSIISTRYGSRQTFTLEEDTAVNIKFSRSAEASNVLTKLMMFKGTTQTTSDYVPYKNICPISGWTSADVMQTGKNLLDISGFETTTSKGITATQNNDGTVSASGTATARATIALGTITFNGTVILNGCPSGGSASGYMLDIRRNGNTIAGSQDTGSGSSAVDVQPDDVVIMRIESGYSFASALVFKPMIRYATVADATFEPYNKTTYTYTFPSEAGTVYGGTLTIRQDGTGTLLVKRAEDDLGARNWTVSADNISFLSSSRPSGDIVPPSQATMPKVICDIYRPSPIIDQLDMSIAIATSGKFKIRDSRFAQPLDATAFKTAMNGVKAVYELAEPVSYELTSQQVIELLKGTNNIWSNAGDTAIKYAADTKLYIDLKFAELQALILENISNS